ncbi:Proline iminopeptidase [Vibrio crassostreae]|uniref:Proline iminopeptidase n=1 Tax=Vibrio crassostreae TaxID=246167 RepID=A0A4R2FWM6_9VIBR|nr:alpha/beta fold hydrolase [Vibrio crassostreae]MDH5948813.1 alpha/beta hydrolase [Vibrio crassostreae]ROO70281.1 alpha/beta hydrolase family protein [Vibrio crassostreae]ROP08789.1 alpha/beta hydrolase family protein [Vibrio crassostreae]ROQ75350.1 alpha/beta hydrolase family protein [Vibrio crassostreae]ROR79722.1 alpha/beta hydrolase family protein [Vibrio crassostreae]
MQANFIDGTTLYRQHSFELPLDYQAKDGQQIQVFARELVDLAKDSQELPWLIYFQGGPGFPSPRVSGQSGWLKRALQNYRVLLLDQRGTGNSTVISHETLAHLSPEQQAEYLSHFRADNIVRDAEAIREQFGVKQWSTIGQSFGGFCTLSYLSLFPQSLQRCYVTGGIPSIEREADDVYRATYKRVEDKNRAFFAQFPQAQAMCCEISDYLLNNDVRLPNGQVFTVEQFQLIGINLGGGEANLPMYFTLESAFVEVNGNKQLSYSFLNQMQQEQGYLTNPIYAILHESIYCQGTASNWSAHRVREQYSHFNYQSGSEFWFTGEMVYPWMFDQLETLKPLREAANMLAEKSDWGTLYNAAQLSKNTVPMACAVYADDMYVELDYSRETLANIPNSKAWITNEYEHNGLRVDGERIVDKLMTMVDSLENLPK